MSEIVTRTIRPIFTVDGGKLRSVRTARRVGLRTLARLLAVSSTYLSRIETAALPTTIGAEFAARLAEWEKRGA